MEKDCTICPWKFAEIRPRIFGRMVSARKVPGKKNRKFGYSSLGFPLFRKICKFLFFYSVSWPSHARMMATRILAAAKFAKKAFLK